LRPRHHAANAIGRKCFDIYFIHLLCLLLGLCHVTLPAMRMAAGPTRPNRPTCRQWQRRQGPAGNGNGGTCHVSPGRGCRHS
jgi:hypothetical protein